MCISSELYTHNCFKSNINSVFVCFFRFQWFNTLVMINDQRAVKWFDIDQQGQLILKQDCSVTGRDTQF